MDRDRRNRIRTALASTFPTLLTVPLCCLLAAAGALPWDSLLALPLALPVHALITFLRLRPAAPLPDTPTDRPAPV